MVDSDTPFPSDLDLSAPVLNDVERGNLRSSSQITVVESKDIVPEMKPAGRSQDDSKGTAHDHIVLAVDGKKVVRTQGKGLTDGDQGVVSPTPYSSIPMNSQKLGQR